MKENQKRKHISEATLEDIKDALKGLDKALGVEINLDDIEALKCQVTAPKRIKRSFKVHVKSRRKNLLTTNHDKIFDYLEKENLIFKDLDALKENERFRYCYEKLSYKQLLFCGLISLDTSFFSKLTTEDLRVYYQSKIDDLFSEGSKLENRDIDTLTKAEKVLIMMFYDDLYDSSSLD